MTPLIDGDKYEVSICGKVFVKERKELLFGRHPKPYLRVYPRKELKLNKNNLGYLQVGVFYRGRRYNRLVHRLVATTFIPNPNNLPEVNHKDLNKTNNSIDNLEWVTRSQNAKHVVDALNIRGSNIKTSKLTEDSVLAIVALSNLGYKQTELASIYGVTNHAIHRILHGHNWSWLTGICRKVGDV